MGLSERYVEVIGSCFYEGGDALSMHHTFLNQLQQSLEKEVLFWNFTHNLDINGHISVKKSQNTQNGHIIKI